MAKEKCAKESQRHGDSRGGPPRFASRASACGSPSGCPRPRFASLTRREKGFYCPFWRRGSLCRAQHDWPDFTCNPARSELAFFRRQNGRAFFPPLPYAALAPRGRRKAYATLADWDALAWWGQFSRAVGWRILETMLACGASRRACRPTAVCARRQTGNHTRPASREACRRAAVTPQPSHFLSSTPRALWARCGVQGVTPCREAFRRTFPKRHTYLYSPARPRRAVRG